MDVSYGGYIAEVCDANEALQVDPTIASYYQQ